MDNKKINMFVNRLNIIAACLGYAHGKKRKLKVVRTHENQDFWVPELFMLMIRLLSYDWNQIHKFKK